MSELFPLCILNCADTIWLRFFAGLTLLDCCS